MKSVVLVCSLLFVSFALGCSGGAEGDASRVETFKVTGKVTKGGTPLGGAVVVFSPSGDQPSAQGKTDSSGEYELTTYDFGDGAAAGDYSVIVSESTAVESGQDEPHGADVEPKKASGHGGAKKSGHGSSSGGGSASGGDSSKTYTVKSGEDNVINIEL